MSSVVWVLCRIVGWICFHLVVWSFGVDGRAFVGDVSSHSYQSPSRVLSYAMFGCDLLPYMMVLAVLFLAMMVLVAILGPQYRFIGILLVISTVVLQIIMRFMCL